MFARTLILIAVIAGLLTSLALPRDVSGNTPPSRSCTCCSPATACCEPDSQPARPAPATSLRNNVDDLKIAMRPVLAVLSVLSGEEVPQFTQLVPQVHATAISDRLDLICIRRI